ncbi:hypothetical protein TNCV_3144761 [Trichonephila clavipes]|nr:hypothetical protein TNCV_3144761 [Trichonephila clavipes]
MCHVEDIDRIQQFLEGLHVSVTLNYSPQSSLVPFLHDLLPSYRCRRFDVLPDSRYLQYTREMFVRENPHSFAT